MLIEMGTSILLTQYMIESHALDSFVLIIQIDTNDSKYMRWKLHIEYQHCSLFDK